MWEKGLGDMCKAFKLKLDRITEQVTTIKLEDDGLGGSFLLLELYGDGQLLSTSPRQQHRAFLPSAITPKEDLSLVSAVNFCLHRVKQ